LHKKRKVKILRRDRERLRPDVKGTSDEEYVS
jgi:hypothetical protein